MKDKKRVQFFTKFVIPFIICITLFCTIVLVNHHNTESKSKTSINASTTVSTSIPTEEEINKLIILNAIINEPYFPPRFTDKEISLLLACQSFVKDHEEEFNSYDGLVQLDDNYTIHLDFETRQLFVRDKQGTERRLLGTYTTIDRNPTDIYYTYDTEHTHGDSTFTFSAHGNMIKEWHLGEEIACYYVPAEIYQDNKKPELLYSFVNSQQILVTDTDSSENAPLFLVPETQISSKNICISNNFSKLPIRVWESYIFFIESNSSLYMYDINTGERTYIAGNVYEFSNEDDWRFFKSDDNTFRINFALDENGKVILKDEKGNPTNSIFSKCK